MENARRGYAALNAAYESGDFSKVAALGSEIWAPDIVLRGGVLAGGEEWHGVDGMLRFFRYQMEAFERMWIEPLEFIDVSDDIFVSVLRIGGRGRYSGLPVDLPMVHVSHLEAGLITRTDTYRSKVEALEAVGLEE